jgi:DNA polymerase-3 subunit epsilon
VCAGKENPAAHHARVAAALARLKALEWPHRGPIGIVETDREREQTEVHVVDRWCYIGTARSEAEVGELLQARRRRFDYDHYRVLARHLAKGEARTVELAA